MCEGVKAAAAAVVEAKALRNCKIIESDGSKISETGGLELAVKPDNLSGFFVVFCSFSR